MRGLGGAFAASGRGGGTEGGNAGDIFGAGAQPALLPAAANERIGDVNVLARADERADAFSPPIWWADSVNRSAPSAAMSQSIRPAACTAST